MRRCFKCGGSLARVRRSFRERLRYTSLYKCRQCGDYSHDDRWFMLLLGDESRCPECGTYRIYKLKSLDRVDRMYKNPLSYCQKFVGAELHWCAFCRLQFYDLRPRVATPNDRTQVPPPPPQRPAAPTRAPQAQAPQPPPPAAPPAASRPGRGRRRRSRKQPPSIDTARSGE